ncbi:uncharacterized protein LOC34618834 [Cyclospora cayetanensis]|uniref:Uncharacterized protein LOC34618834 n=1 Tax=Cyclospora cayetanensis TaxID=88456 RepID=A0A6P6S170_9EIME|nr:uncharacterized protein LOC34618834 [Cyclospora cayetanensis]
MPAFVGTIECPHSARTLPNQSPLISCSPPAASKTVGQHGGSLDGLHDDSQRRRLQDYLCRLNETSHDSLPQPTDNDRGGVNKNEKKEESHYCCAWRSGQSAPSVRQPENKNEECGERRPSEEESQIPGILGESAGYRYALGGILVYYEGCGAERATGASDPYCKDTRRCSATQESPRGFLKREAATERPGSSHAHAERSEDIGKRETGGQNVLEARRDIAQRREAPRKGKPHEGGVCFCCSSQQEIVRRRGLNRCCCCCPYRDCRVPLSQCLARALGEESDPSVEGKPVQQNWREHLQHVQRQLEGQCGESDRSREMEPVGKQETEKGIAAKKTGAKAQRGEMRGSMRESHSRKHGYCAEEGEGVQNETRERPLNSLLHATPEVDSSLLQLLQQLPLPAPPCAEQLVETAWKPADTKARRLTAGDKPHQLQQHAWGSCVCVQLVVPLDSLIFESRFESGNLLAAVKGIYEPNIYLLLLRPDTKKNNKTFWFFFSAERTAEPKQGARPLTVTFKILNLVKENPFYCQGHGAPLVFSPKAFRERREGWRRIDCPVRFYKNRAAAAVNYIFEGCSPPSAAPFVSVPKRISTADAVSTADPSAARPGVLHWSYDVNSPVTDLRRSYFSLEFDFTFTEETGDRIFFASALPYTYSDLLDLTAAMQTMPHAKRYCSVGTLCKTPGNIPCPVFLIGDPPESPLLQQHKSPKQRRQYRHRQQQRQYRRQKGINAIWGVPNRQGAPV